MAVGWESYIQQFSRTRVKGAFSDKQCTSSNDDKKRNNLLNDVGSILFGFNLKNSVVFGALDSS